MYDEDWELLYQHCGDSSLELDYALDHEWIPVLLLTNTVWDCVHCGAHKEKVETGEQFKTCRRYK